MDTRLKERLIGAVALVLIVVLVVPELLTGPRRSAAPPPSEGPAQVRTVVVDLAQSGPVIRPAAEEPAVVAPAAAPDAAPDAAAVPAASPDTSPPAAPPALAVAPAVRGTPPPTEAATPAATAPKAAPAGVKAAPQPAASEPPMPASVAAPKPTALEAPKPAAHPPQAAAAATEGWVVQLGSFASRENGEKLAKLLRAKGYRAFVSEFRGSNRVLFRVRVGPEQDRARAEAIAARLSRDGYKGSVAPH